MDIIRPSENSCGSPLHMVPKNSSKSGAHVETIAHSTAPDRYLIPQILDLRSDLAGLTLFSRIDLVRAYNQIPVAEADISRTVVVTPFGLLEFLRMTISLSKGAQSF
ncbi:unnamed protein product [Echinostoma caproni]|uniref:Reverse transcriptase domain-containing protein n=1 Tax=Echinostoma caproni TaxID=27848 RepID=A0A183AQ40_9TREM|nr:unnamed protein product [Echinostoma caproni]